MFLWAGSLLLLIHSLMAQNPAPKAALTTTQAIEAARAELQKDRVAAVKILLSAHDNEVSSVRQRTVQREIEKLSTVFFTNEGQKNFEMAESLRLSGKDKFLPKYQLALQQEPYNKKVLIGYTLALLTHKNCQKSYEILGHLEKLNPRIEELPVLRWTSALCNGETPADMGRLSESTNEAIDLYLKTLRGQKLVLAGESEAGLKLLKAAVLRDENYPTPHFWAWRAQSTNADKEAALNEAQKFLTLCKSMSSSLRRRYYLDPHICTSTAEVEEYVKLMEGERL